MNNINSFEKACEFLGYVAQDEVPYAEPKNDRQLAVNAFAKTVIVIAAINANEDGTLWVPDFDTYEEKYEIWWNMRSKAAGGPGFSYYDYTYVYSFSYVGARLVFRSRARGRYFADTFADLAAGWMVIQ